MNEACIDCPVVWGSQSKEWVADQCDSQVQTYKTLSFLQLSWKSQHCRFLASRALILISSGVVGQSWVLPGQLWAAAKSLSTFCWTFRPGTNRILGLEEKIINKQAKDTNQKWRYEMLRLFLSTFTFLNFAFFLFIQEVKAAKPQGLLIC